MQRKNREISVLKDRILQYLDNKGISKYECYQNTGITNGVFSQKSGISEDNILRFLSYYTDISAEWFLKGEGEMIKSDYQQESISSVVAESKVEYEKTDKDKYIEGLERENNRLINEIERLHGEIELKDELLRAFRTGQIVYAPHASDNKEKDAG